MCRIVQLFQIVADSFQQLSGSFLVAVSFVFLDNRRDLLDLSIGSGERRKEQGKERSGDGDAGQVDHERARCGSDELVDRTAELREDDGSNSRSADGDAGGQRTTLREVGRDDDDGGKVHASEADTAEKSEEQVDLPGLLELAREQESGGGKHRATDRDASDAENIDQRRGKRSWKP